MFPASLLVLLMILLLPHASLGRQGQEDAGQANVDPSAPALESTLAQTIQNLLLSRLGLQSHPDPRPGAAVPQYLLDLYQFHSQQYHLIQDPHFSYPSQHVQGANTVRSFQHSGRLPQRPGGIHASLFPGQRPQRCRGVLGRCHDEWTTQRLLVAFGMGLENNSLKEELYNVISDKTRNGLHFLGNVSSIALTSPKPEPGDERHWKCTKFMCCGFEPFENKIHKTGRELHKHRKSCLMLP